MLNIGGHSELWVKDGDNHDTFAVVAIMKEYIVGHILKAILTSKNLHMRHYSRVYYN